MGKKYVEDKFYVEEYGMEQCKLMDAYYENEQERKDKLLEQMTSYESRKQLAELLNSKTGLNLVYEIKVAETRQGSKYVEIESNEIKNNIIALAWKSFKLCNFGGNFWTRRNKNSHYGNEEDFTKFAPEIGYGASIDFAYEHNDGGSNGAKVGQIRFTESSGKWEFELVEVR